MTEEDTFKKLRKASHVELMAILMQSVGSGPYLFSYQNPDGYTEWRVFREVSVILKQNGWTDQDFLK